MLHFPSRMFGFPHNIPPSQLILTFCHNSQMENAFLSCFIANMSSSLENLIRNEAMQGNQAIPRDSPEFMELVRKAATREDCVNVLNPLDISKRERYAWDAQVFFFSYLSLLYFLPLFLNYYFFLILDFSVYCVKQILLAFLLMMCPI